MNNLDYLEDQVRMWIQTLNAAYHKKDTSNLKLNAAKDALIEYWQELQSLNSSPKPVQHVPFIKKKEVK